MSTATHFREFKGYVLVLPSWYPSKLDESNGDFNERLVYAVSGYNKQIVVYVSTLRGSKLKETEVSEGVNIITYKAYFPHSDYDLINLLRMTRLYLSVFKQIFSEYGLPKLVHNYVFFPSGIITIYLKYRFRLKTVLTEHWTAFDVSRSNSIKRHSFYRRILYKYILGSFDAIIAVSEQLRHSISQWKKEGESYVLPNVVNVDYFNMEQLCRTNAPFTFIHVSNMGAHDGFHKNVIGILTVFNRVIEGGKEANLILVGKENQKILDFIENNVLLRERVTLLGELSYPLVSEAMKKAHAFILFSRYENLPCVILEALCCGLPVISSNVGGIATILDETNGLLVESENETQLYEAIILMVDTYHQYDVQSISERAVKSFNYDHVGKKTNDIYQKLLG